MTVHPAHNEKNGYIMDIESHVEDMLSNAKTTDFGGIVGHSFNGGGYQPGYDFFKRYQDRDYDIILSVHVRKEA
jgi:hypothetical protein